MKFKVTLRPQRSYGLLGTGSPGRPPRLSHSYWALCFKALFFTSIEGTVSLKFWLFVCVRFVLCLYRDWFCWFDLRNGFIYEESFEMCICWCVWWSGDDPVCNLFTCSNCVIPKLNEYQKKIILCYYKSAVVYILVILVGVWSDSSICCCHNVFSVQVLTCVHYSVVTIQERDCACINVLPVLFLVAWNLLLTFVCKVLACNLKKAKTKKQKKAQHDCCEK